MKRCKVCRLPVSIPHALDCSALSSRTSANTIGDTVAEVNERTVEGRRVYPLSTWRDLFPEKGGAR